MEMETDHVSYEASLRYCSFVKAHPVIAKVFIPTLSTKVRDIVIAPAVFSLECVSCVFDA